MGASTLSRYWWSCPPNRATRPFAAWTSCRPSSRRRRSARGGGTLAAALLRGLYGRPVSAFPLGQLARHDCTEGGGFPDEPCGRIGQRIQSFEPNTAGGQRSEQQRSPDVWPVVQVRLHSGGSSEGQGHHVQLGFLRRPPLHAASIDGQPLAAPP